MFLKIGYPPVHPHEPRFSDDIHVYKLLRNYMAMSYWTIFDHFPFIGDFVPLNSMALGFIEHPYLFLYASKY